MTVQHSENRDNSEQSLHPCVPLNAGETSDDDCAWDILFAQSDAFFARMAATITADIAAGRVIALDCHHTVSTTMNDPLIQPIATAPTTTPSPWLLLFDWDWQIGWWHPVLGWVAPSDDGFRPITPTHWRPLPPDPKSP